MSQEHSALEIVGERIQSAIALVGVSSLEPGSVRTSSCRTGTARACCRLTGLAGLAFSSL